MASMRSRHGALLDGPAPPRVRVAPPARDNSWEDVADLAATLGFPLDEWQEQALEAAMGERVDGRWASKFVGISAPRQNGKSQLIVARALAGVLLFGEKTIIISAHETDTAREIWRRMIDVIEDNPTLEARVTARMNAVNRESLTFGDGLDKQTIKLKARGLSGSRGFSADCLLLDEAQILGKQAWGSIVPTMSARPNPQLWLFGTPPTERDDPFAFSRVRESASRGKARHCWLEWSAEPGDDFDSAETWAKANPSYGVRISHEACADDRAAMDDQQFAMERLGMWSEFTAASVFGPGAWEACAGTEYDGKFGCLVVATAVDQSMTCVAGAAFDGKYTAKPLEYGKGQSWAVASLRALYGLHRVPVVVDGRGPAAALVPHLEAAGVPVVALSTADVLDAHANLYQLVQDGDFTHGKYPELEAAVSGATTRAVGDRWAWARRKSAADISPLEAVTLGVGHLYRPSFVSVYEDRGAVVL